MEKQFPGSERHIDRLRRQGLILDAPFLFSGVTLLTAGLGLYVGHRSITESFARVTNRCWGSPDPGVEDCLNGMFGAGWIEIMGLLSIVSLVSLFSSWMVKRPRLELGRLGINGSRLSPEQWVSRLRQAPLLVVGYGIVLLGGGMVLLWICRGDVIQGFLPGTVEELSRLMTRAVAGAGVVIGATSIVSGAIGFWRYRQKTRMTAQEVRQEHKDDAGDPLLKGQQRSLHHAMLHEELVKAVRRSAVVFVAPTQQKEMRV